MSDMPKCMDWEEFKKKGYHVVPLLENYKPTPALRWFAEGRACDTPDTSNPKRGTDKAHELATYSGKIEFVSQSLMAHAGDDERPPCRTTSPAGKDTTSGSSRSIRSSSSRRIRASRSTPTTTSTAAGSRRYPSHRMRWTATPRSAASTPIDAEARGIKHGDVVKLYNERGAVLCAAVVTERVAGRDPRLRGAANYDPLEPATRPPRPRRLRQPAHPRDG